MPENQSLSGIIIVNKPVGLTSFQVVGKIRKLLGVKKVGHCGTLDPFASGVLPVCVGKATRVIRYMDEYDKAYRCTAHFGACTDTQDREGRIIGGKAPTKEEMEQMNADNFQAIRTLFSDLNGEKEQLPPMYSAIKMAGRPLYKYARKGITLDRKTRTIRLYDCIVHRISTEEGVLKADFSLSCSKGTYIRTICDDLGRESGFGAYASSLQRTRCGDFLIENALTLEEIEKLHHAERTEEFLLPEDLAVSHMMRFEVTQEEAGHIRLGQQLPLSLFEDRIIRTDAGDICRRHYCAYFMGSLLAIVLPDEKEGRMILRIERMLA